MWCATGEPQAASTVAACFLTRLERSRLKFADRAGRSPDKRWLWAFPELEAGKPAHPEGTALNSSLPKQSKSRLPLIRARCSPTSCPSLPRHEQPTACKDFANGESRLPQGEGSTRRTLHIAPTGEKTGRQQLSFNLPRHHDSERHHSISTRSPLQRLSADAP